MGGQVVQPQRKFRDNALSNVRGSIEFIVPTEERDFVGGGPGDVADATC